MAEGEEVSFKEQRIRSLTNLYYSRSDIQKAIFDFSKNRETVPRYYEGFGKRPDALQYKGDIFELVKKGATSFHCSEEIWKDPLQLSTNMNESQLNELRRGWDLLIDIDSKYIDYSKIMAGVIYKFLNFNGIKNVGCKFSGSKGFHLIIPWKAFPKEVAGVSTSSMFPEWPRIMTKYIIATIEKDIIKEISNLEKPNKYIRDFQASKEVMPDLILVSPRHLFRAPYSLHEKTSMASAVIDIRKVRDFEVKDADPLKVKINEFTPDCRDGEAKELLSQALDWYKHSSSEKQERKKDFKPIKLEKVSDSYLPPSIQKILLGVEDGKKRALFILLNLFRSIGMERDEIEKRIEEWNKKNKPPLKEGYIKAQLEWSYRNKIVPPPNFDKDYYPAIGIVPTPEEMRSKNPVSFMVRRSRIESNNQNQDKKYKKEK